MDSDTLIKFDKLLFYFIILFKFKNKRLIYLSYLYKVCQQIIFPKKYIQS